MITLYGIPNCDTVKKARNWLDSAQIAYDFHDYKKRGIDAATLAGWCAALGWERVINRAGTSWRKLDETARNGMDQAAAIAAMIANPSLIKRPILAHSGGLLLGFSAEVWAEPLGTNRNDHRI